MSNVELRAHWFIQSVKYNTNNMCVNDHPFIIINFKKVDWNELTQNNEK